MVAVQELCKPYLSGVLFHCGNVTEDLLSGVKNAIEELVLPEIDEDADDAKFTRSGQTIEPNSGEHEEMAWKSFHYTEYRKPAWYQGGEVLDQKQHIIILCGHNNYLKILFSDNSVRDQVMRGIRKGNNEAFDGLRPFSADDIKKSLVADRVRTLWLSGTHRQSVVKADSKTLSGMELESAIDPLGDQTYFYSSIRSTVDNAEISGNDASAVIGVSPQHARFWIGPTKDWNDFLSRAKALMSHVHERLQSEDTPDVLSMLAQPTKGLDDVAEPYGVSLIIPESQFPGAVIDGDQAWLQIFADTAHYEIETQEGSPDFEADVFWANRKIGRLAFSFSEKENGDVQLTIDVLDDLDVEDDIKEQIVGICTNKSLVTIYFDTGHSFARGQLYKTAFRDPKFNDWKWINTEGFNPKKEKPPKASGKSLDVEKIGQNDDDSLFTYVVKNWPNIHDHGNPTGWLVCDDGSMESADFIHIDPTAGSKKISLIHVKGSGSENPNRGISVTDYEVVVGQAVKNLRHLDQGHLYNKLLDKKDGVLKDAVWKDGVRQEDRNEVLEVIEGFGTDYDLYVYVLQPRVRQSEWTTTRDRINAGDPDNATMLRLKQLDTLLLGASTDCHGLGAKFYAIGAE